MSQLTSVTGQKTAGVRMHWLYFAADSPQRLEAGRVRLRLDLGLQRRGRVSCGHLAGIPSRREPSSCWNFHCSSWIRRCSIPDAWGSLARTRSSAAGGSWLTCAASAARWSSTGTTEAWRPSVSGDSRTSRLLSEVDDRQPRVVCHCRGGCGLVPLAAVGSLHAGGRLRTRDRHRAARERCDAGRLPPHQSSRRRGRVPADRGANDADGGDVSKSALSGTSLQATSDMRPRRVRPLTPRTVTRFVCMIAYTNYAVDARVRREAETLAAAGYAVRCLTTKNSATARHFTLDGVEIRELGVQKYRGKSTARLHRLVPALSSGLASAACVRLLFKGELDVVHVHNLPDFLVFAGLVPRLCGVKVVLDVHDSVPETFATKFSDASVLWKVLVPGGADQCVRRAPGHLCQRSPSVTCSSRVASRCRRRSSR